MHNYPHPRNHLVGVLLLIVSLSACNQTPGTDAMPATAWTLEDYAPQTADGIRVLIIHDMEGLAGQSDPSSFDFGTDLYPMGQEWLAADINAVVDGLFALTDGALVSIDETGVR